MPTIRQFQHTAARRRLAISVRKNPAEAGFNTQPPEGGWGNVQTIESSEGIVSTHSRPKAAGSAVHHAMYRVHGFNTQPPEGGWVDSP